MIRVRSMMARYVVAEAGEIPPGERKIVTVAGISIGVFNLKGEFFALRNRCPHQGGPLCEGKLWGLIEAEVPGEVRFSREGEILTCGWHGWEFDIRTGQSWCEPGRLRTRSYEVTVEAGADIASEAAPAIGMVPGPYVAETYPVSTQGQYIVVDLDPND
jgi:nitrite reductase/ring-hydroxylating ferredoxin subunit